MKSYQQTMDHTCGACCVQTVLEHFGRPVPSERSLAYRLKANFHTGIEPKAIVEYLRAVHLHVEMRTSQTVGFLIRRLRNYMPIICWSDWGGHYCVVTGYRQDARWSGGRFILADPAARYDGRPNGFTEVSADRLRSMWRTPGQNVKGEAIYIKA